METNLSYATPPNALRIFHGFRNPILTQKEFLDNLGQKFIPGTPYMLKPLGLSAYIPGVVMKENEPDILDEFAIVAYPSQDVWKRIMNETLRGRVYNLAHSGVFDPKRSGASFPIFIKQLSSDATDPYYLFKQTTDWQIGVTKVFIGTKANSTVTIEEFRKTVRREAEASIEQLNFQGFDQCVIMPGDNYVVIWTHSNIDVTGAIPDWKSMEPNVRGIANLEVQRILCQDEEPPMVQITQTTALNFIFVRESRMFLI